MDIQSDSLKKQVGKFAVVGVINTLVDVIILNSLVFLGFTAILTIFGQKFLIANIISVAIAMINSFILNKQWTFKTEGGNIYKQIFQFLAITIIGMFVIHQIIFNTLYYELPSISNLIILIIHFLKLNNIFSDSFIMLNFAKIIAIIGSLIWNFIGYKFIVFKNKTA
ncbi:MAG: GtrA family protein [Patescibacteria group bacterium]